ADEPTGNLDTRTSLEVLALLQKLNKEMGITIVLVTHEADIAACARRVITLRDERVVSDVVSESPTHAEGALTALSPPACEQGSSTPETVVRAAGPRNVPLAASAWPALGGLLGVIAGLVYIAIVLGVQHAFMPLLLLLVGEAIASLRAFP